MNEKHGSWKAYDKARYYVPYSYVSEDSVAAAIARQAREEVDFARGELTRYRKHVNRATVRGTDNADSKHGISYGLWALHEVCDAFNRAGDITRLAKVLRYHAEKLEKAFGALYDQDNAQIRKAREAESAARWA